MFKKTIIFLIILALWFFSSIFFPFDAGFFNSLNLPSYSPPGIFISIIWIIIYILNTISIYTLIKDNEINNDYLFILIINYIFNQTFSLFFFTFNSLILTLINIVILLVTTITFYDETKKINKTASYYLIPYVIWTTFATILFINIFLIN